VGNKTLAMQKKDRQGAMGCQSGEKGGRCSWGQPKKSAKKAALGRSDEKGEKKEDDGGGPKKKKKGKNKTGPSF